MPMKVKSATDAELKAVLGSAMTLWSGIVATVEGARSPVEAEWRPSKSEFGRVCLLRHKKRTLLYLTPESERITVAIVLGERACALAMASSLPAAIKKQLAEATPYAEGRGIRFAATSRSAIAVIRTLVEIKIAPR